MLQPKTPGLSNGSQDWRLPLRCHEIVFEEAGTVLTLAAL
jgi:hypothetical protein